MTTGKTPICVTIAGSDSGGGAGIQADLKTFSALGAYGASVITALTAQNTLGVSGIHDVPADFVSAQIDAVFSDLAVDAVKIGMLSQSDVIAVVAERLIAHGMRTVVLDPVMVATSGDVLIAGNAERDIVERLFSLATVITPNLQEAAKLLGDTPAASRDEMVRQAAALLDLGPGAVLLKGGHSVEEAISPDVLVRRDAEPVWFTSPRYETSNTHGTGCTLSSAIAAGLARGYALEPAIGAAKSYIAEAIRAADQLGIGRGHGPVHHFHDLWPQLRHAAE